MNATRVITAIGRIGYGPVAAILDIADNSVSSGATKIAVDIEATQEEREGAGRRRAVLSRVLVRDNGSGMNDVQLDRAVALGSEADGYSAGTLSKFGMGLKSAASSLGGQLTIVSRGDDAVVRTAIIDHSVIALNGEYVYELREATSDEVEELDKVAEGGTGTTVAVTNIHQDSMPKPAEIEEGLRERLGITYSMYITDGVPDREAIEISLGGAVVEPVDPLFSEEANTNGDLDERTWDGLDVKWIQRPQKFQLSEDGSIFAEVAITQLPHPPSVAIDAEIPQAQTRRQYSIGAGNYGFYIFRNGRLISWAESLGYVPSDQDLYSFRGRVDITSAADDVLNIDVTKSRVSLSDIARLQLTPIVREAVRKSREAWKARAAAITARANDTPHDDINEQLDRVEELEDKSDQLDEDVAPADERERLKKRREGAAKAKPATEEESENLRSKSERVQYVPVLDNDQLWERAHDASQGLFVRVNAAHRFVREVIDAANNPGLTRAFDLLMFALARAEYSSVYKSEVDERVVESIMQEFRERLGGELSDILRQIDPQRVLGDS